MFHPYAGSRASLAISAMLARGPMTSPEIAQVMGTEARRIVSYLAQALLVGAVVRGRKRKGHRVFKVVPALVGPAYVRDGHTRKPKPPPLPPMSLADIANTGDTPCERYACPQKARCATGLACNAWVIYVATGRAHNPRRFALPTAETLAIAEREGVAQVGRHGVAWKSMFIDKPELWA